MDWLAILILVIKGLVLALAATGMFAYFTLFERTLLARFQHRVGPNRAGAIPLPGGGRLFGGVLQPIADAIKLFFKEDVTPILADKWVYLISPGFAVIPAIIIWATMPLGYWPDGMGGNWLQVAEINVGILYLLAVTSLGVYGIAIAGWASNNKYSMLGGIRASAQVISYELALGLAILGVVMQASSFSTGEIVAHQTEMWNIVPQFLGFIIFLIAATAEVVRSPFDLVEAEQELVGGYNTEYGSMKFALFFMSEYVKLIAMNAVGVMLFLGGWNFPGLATLREGLLPIIGDSGANAVFGLLSLGSFLLKTAVLSFVSVWVRATVPRVRYDQLMNLGWKVLLPLALVQVVVTALIGVLMPSATAGDRLVANLVSFVIGLVVVLVVGMRSNKPAIAQNTVTLVKKASGG